MVPGLLPFKLSGAIDLLGDRMKKHKVILIFSFSLGLLVLLFVAGVVVPSLLYSSHALSISPADSLRTLDIAGVTFSYKLENIGSAFLGILFGTTVALFLSSPGLATGTAFWRTVLRVRNQSGQPC
jgi:ABC-type sulfate transport system permease component